MGDKGLTTAISRTNSSRCCSKALGVVVLDFDPGGDIVHAMDWILASWVFIKAC